MSDPAAVAPVIVWFRRDLRLSDHPALSAAVETGAPILPVFIRDSFVERLGAAPKWRVGAGLEAFAKALADRGSRLILRSGDAQSVLEALIAETGARMVYWARAYEPELQERDAAIKRALTARGIKAKSFSGHLLFDPWTVQTKTGGFYKVYTPMWKAVRDSEIEAPLPAPGCLVAPPAWPRSENLADWHLGAAMNRGAKLVSKHAILGESAAQRRLESFIETRVADYDRLRDIPAQDGTSRLSQNLSLGEISPRQCWHAGLRARAEGKVGAEVFLKELVWREFAYHLLHHTPHITTSNWRQEWDAFPWNTKETPEVTAWKRGRTGVPFVDAAMREMYVTGTMHNRGRMIVACYLTKHLMTHWKIGLDWFEECLIDWDPASNAMGWQWSAGSGPDATPYFRVFNPETQLDKFDRDRAYTRAWIAEDQGRPPETATDYFAAIPQSWGLSVADCYPQPVVTPEAGRRAALEAYQGRAF
ncbi:MAG: deoxyribodipyrimidine photo-lyase [Pseudomonadota bacterium]